MSGRSRWVGYDDSHSGHTQHPFSQQIVGNSDNENQDLTMVTHRDSGLSQFFRREDDGPNSDYYRCYYHGVQQPLLCEKVADCCTRGCCSKDLSWLGGIWVLIAFVIIVFVVGVVLAVVCYKKSRTKAKKDSLYYYADSHHPFSGSEYGAPY